MLEINSIISIVNVRTIFGHTPTSDNFWTDICLTSRTSDELGQTFFLKLVPLITTVRFSAKREESSPGSGGREGRQRRAVRQISDDYIRTRDASSAAACHLQTGLKRHKRITGHVLPPPSTKEVQQIESPENQKA